MRTISLLNELRRVLPGLVLSMAACHMASAEADHVWRVSVGNQATVKIDRTQVRVEQSLLTRLRHAEAAAFLPLELAAGSSESSWRWLLVREASRARGDAGFCGAGYEDHLLLVKVTKFAGVAVDDFLAQSCLKSVSMDVDQFHELMDVIDIDKEAKQLSFRQSIFSDTDSFRQEVHILFVSGRMNTSVRKVAY